MSTPTTDLSSVSMLEANETAAYRSLFQVGRSLFGPDAFRCEDRQGSVAFLCPAVGLPGAFNRVLMLGLHRPIDAAQVADLVALYDEAGCGMAIELPQQIRNDAVSMLLKPHRIRRGSTAAVVAHWEPATAPPPSRSEAAVAAIATGEDCDVVADICADVFSMSTPVREVLRALCREPEWIPWLVRHQGEPAGAGLTRINRGGAWFGWAATLPQFRGLGVKGTLDDARLHEAGRRGCRLVSSETAAGTPERPDHSLKSFVRRGFQVTHLRDTLFKAAAGAGKQGSSGLDSGTAG